MAHLMRLACATLEHPSPPGDLLRPALERFVSRAEMALHTFDGQCGQCRAETSLTGRTDCEEQIESVAQHRYRSARRDWLDVHHVPREDESRAWPARWPAFAAVTKRAERRPRRGTVS